MVEKIVRCIICMMLISIIAFPTIDGTTNEKNIDKNQKSITNQIEQSEQEINNIHALIESDHRKKASVEPDSIESDSSDNKEIPYDDISKGKHTEEEYIPGELIVKFKENIPITISESEKGYATTTISSIDLLNEQHKVTSIKKIFTGNDPCSLSSFYKFSLNEDSDIYPTIDEYQKNPAIEHVGPNYLMYGYNTPNDPYFITSGSWGQEFQDLYGMHKINANGAWNISTGSSDIVVAVLDTGVDYNHEDIQDNMWINTDEIPDNGIDDDSDGFIDNIYGADFAYNDGDPMDGYGHGTHCAGTIAAVGDNYIGVVGVNWNSRIMAVKGLKDSNSGPASNLAEAIYWIADNGADIISNSWGPKFRTPSVPIIEAAVQYAYDKGCVLVFSAGNQNDDVQYYSPQNMEETIVVAATNHQDYKASFSNWGEKVDVSAPGVEILSLRANGTDMYGNGIHIVDDKYYWANGTSMACPHVAGLAGLILSKYPNCPNGYITELISSSVDNIDSLNPEYSGLLGSGRINAEKALNEFEHNIRVQPLDVADYLNPDELIYINTILINNGENNETDVEVKFLVDDIQIDSTIISFFEKKSIQEVGWWYDIPQDTGMITFCVNITPVENETYLEDNKRSKDAIIGEDIAVSQLVVPDIFVHGIIKETKGYVENLGLNDHTVTVQLIVNNTVENSTDIFLPSGTGQWMTFLYDGSSTGFGIYEVKIHAVPVSGEGYLLNQNLSQNVSFIPEFIYVDDDAQNSWYDTFHVSTIQEGVNAAADLCTIFVHNGTYYGNIIVNKSLNITGEDKISTTIYAENTDESIISIITEDVSFNGFTVSGNTNTKGINVMEDNLYGVEYFIYDNIISENKYGIFIKNYSSSNGYKKGLVSNNSIVNNIYGVSCHSINNPKIINNHIENNEFGIYSTKNCEIVSNTVLNNTYGIISENSEGRENILDNKIRHNEKGITLNNSSLVSIRNNFVTDNNIGITIKDGRHTTSITNNYFNNTNNTDVSCLGNYWFHLPRPGKNIVGGEYTGGNYWSDYIGYDYNGDGLGDIPYIIYGLYNHDNYPLMIPKNLQSIQQINLYEGWNWVSFNVEPEDMIMTSIVQSIIDEGSLEIIQDEGTGVIWPDYGIDTIGEMNITEGYKIKVTQDTLLNVSGIPVKLPVQIPLYEGWNLIGYPVSESRNALDVMQSLIDNGCLIKVLDKSENEIYFDGSEWINEIGDFMTESAYYIKVNADSMLSIFEEQVINMSEGLNWISFNVQPDNTSLAYVFGHLGDTIYSVRNQVSVSYYFPEYDLWFGTLEQITDGEMYQVKMLESFSDFTVSGTLIDPSTPIPLDQGWNWIAYYPQNPLNIDIALYTIKENVIEVKSQTQSATYNPQTNIWTGNLTELEPGQGYKIYMNAVDTLFYPDI